MTTQCSLISEVESVKTGCLNTMNELYDYKYYYMNLFDSRV